MCQITPMRRSPLGLAAATVLSDSVVHGVELMVASYDLAQASTGVREHREVTNQGQKPGSLEHAVDERFEFRHALGRDCGAVDRAPRHEPFDVGCQRADACAEAHPRSRAPHSCGTGTVSGPCRSEAG